MSVAAEQMMPLSPHVQSHLPRCCSIFLCFRRKSTCKTAFLLTYGIKYEHINPPCVLTDAVYEAAGDILVYIASLWI